MFKNKIIDKEKLIKRLKSHKSKSKKIVLCHGVFDLVHIGHIKYFLSKKIGRYFDCIFNSRSICE